MYFDWAPILCDEEFVMFFTWLLENSLVLDCFLAIACSFLGHYKWYQNKHQLDDITVGVVIVIVIV